MFGYNEEQIAAFGMSFGLGAFMLYMLFIIWNLAKQSKAGKFGAFMLFFVLGLGIFGFCAKLALEWFLGQGLSGR